VYEREFPGIARMVLSHGGTVENACDIFQDAMVILLEKIGHGKLTLSSSIGTYLYSVCRHILGDRFRPWITRTPPQPATRNTNASRKSGAA
jgi:DNA-directed RNA polymerase specialized sigma24 family protein